MRNYIIILLFAILILPSCMGGSSNMLPPANGKLSHLLVVMEKNKWKAAPGDSMRAVLRHFYSGLPQEEPLFDISQIPKEAFSSIFRRNKNIIRVNISRNTEKSGVTVTRNRWAKPQVVVTINAKNSADFFKIFSENSAKITDVFLSTERNRLIKTYSKLKDHKISKRLVEKFGISMSVPSGFEIYHDTLNFMWVRRESNRLTQAMIIWKYNYKDTSDLSLNGIVAMRDSMTLKFVPGPADGSFMTTEKRVPFDFFEQKMDNHYVAEVRGLWKVEGYFMGGPFISFSIVDEKEGTITTVDAFVYAGKQNKRDFVKEMEAILYSLKFPK